MTAKPPRAKPLPVEDRRAMLIDATLPLLLEHGNAVTTRQIADRAGIAEGTIFRAFDSKDDLIDAVVARQVDPEPFRRRLRGIDTALPLEERITAIVALMRNRFTTVFSLMSVIGHRGPHPSDDSRREFAEIIARILSPDLDRLTVSAERAAQVIRMLTLAASVPHVRNGPEFDDAEIAALILHGIDGIPAPGPMAPGSSPVDTSLPASAPATDSTLIPALP
ncbi:TetR/AcrR family transcriptional regulator [Cryobacterium algoricola]|uniref:TetR/AcrR family transcriptional regulator n=1 Tax=Cryobacterium algoricola TaxID=1259183 RepID=A0ABY2IB21_9MICO|nr:TetR/AcrR family transcriptional regulator [Cryobacterium algoricola]TFB84085.1 TetR/AcrR family transcriptional regulator [Cryobacterium algoricola]